MGSFIAFPRFLDIPTFHYQVPPRPPRRERSQRRKWELWARMLSGNFAEMTTSTPLRDLLHAANLRHGTDGFIFPPKEGVLRIFSPLRIRRLRSGLNPRTWVLKASTLPLDHRSPVYSEKILDARGLQELGICTAAVPLSPLHSTYITVFQGNRGQKTI